MGFANGTVKGNVSPMGVLPKSITVGRSHAPFSPSPMSVMIAVESSTRVPSVLSESFER